MSTAGFHVFMADLLKAASTFEEQSGVLNAVMPAGGPACPDGGGSDINQIMQAAAAMLGLEHTNLAAVVGQHATRLRAAYQAYSKSETGVSKLAYEITNPGNL
jgi:hypothetical protein